MTHETNLLMSSFILLLLLQFCTARDTITTIQSLKDGQSLVSGNGTFALGFFSPGKSTNRYLGVWYNNVSEQTVVWVANRNKPINDTSGVLSFDNTGNLVIHGPDKKILVWSSNVSASGNVFSAQLLNSGNLVVFQGDSKGPVSRDDPGIGEQWIDHSVFHHVAQETDAYALWMKLEGMYQSKTARNKALIMRRLINLKLKNGVSVAEHTSEFHSLVNQLASIKMELEDEMQALLLLSSLPDSWETLVVSLSNSAPEGKLTMGMVTDALFNEEARKKEMDGEQSHALVTESRGRDRERGRGRGRSKSRGRSQSRQDNTRRCFYCDQEDHVIRDCPEKKADRQAKEKAKGHGGPSTTAVAVHSSDDEEVMLTVSSELKTPGWILDSGCTFHICADRKLFSTYRRVSGSIIRMANNTVNRVVGIGTVRFLTKDGRKVILSEVRHVPGVRRNLISLSMLDLKGNCFSSSGGVLHVHRGDREMLQGKLCNKLYRLEGEVLTKMSVVKCQSKGTKREHTQPKRMIEPGFHQEWRKRCTGTQGGSSKVHRSEPVKPILKKVQSKETKSVETMPVKKRECLKNCSCQGYSSAEISLGGIESGCVTWHGDLMDTRELSSAGQDLYIRVDAVELAQYLKSQQSHAKKGMVVAIVVSSIAALFFVICLLSWLVMRKRKAKRRQNNLLFSPNSSTSFKATETGDQFDESRTNAELPLFDLTTIVAATNNFSFSNKLGQGGFGIVYKGQLHNGQEMAVKRLAKNSGQGVKEFKNEATLIAKLQHRNLVRLLGCCIQQDEKMLIYEYLPNKGLDSFIFDKAKGSSLEWRKRFEIILGITRGMVYLHQDSRLRIIHRDLKASNVLLDASMNPKISDFGMAKIFGVDQIEANTNRVVGTYGYMSPEYAMEGLFSIKSDVFSFGVLLLEIISGRKNNSYNQDNFVNLIGHVWNLWGEEKALDIVDSSLAESCSSQEVLRCIHIGLLCVEEFTIDRPTMSDIAFMLCNETTLPPPKQPAFICNRPGGPYWSLASGRAPSINDLTLTTIQAR
ncbi:unnamed protein product [Camellia sinensis]